MFGYVTDLRSMSQGRATSTMQFARYEEVPTAVAEEIMAKVAGKPAQRVGSRSEERRVGKERRPRSCRNPSRENGRAPSARRAGKWIRSSGPAVAVTAN